MGNGKKTLAKVVAMLMAATSLFSIAGCGEDPNKDKTVILVKNFGGGVGRAWLDNAIVRFKEKIGDKQYEEGKTGIHFEITSNTSVSSMGLQTDGTHLYFLQEKYSNLYNLIQLDAVLEITDIVKDQTLEEYGENVTIESKIDERYRFAMQGTGDHADKYYMLPHYETQCGASYDMDLFEEMGFYLAKPGAFTSYKSELVGETFYFTDVAEEKTVGNDGIEGTDDDGLPTTLNELVAMCEYIKNNNVWPFSAPGGHKDYANHLIEGLWTALAGYEQRAAVTAMTGEVDYVTGISSEELWKGTGIMKPNTVKADVTVETGYKAINQAARYYAFAFMELAADQGWFYDGYLNPDYNHKAAMRSFILNGLGGYEKIAAHVEGSYWYNEAESYGLFNDYKTYSGGKEVKNIGHWHMPTTVDGPVVTGEDNAREEAAINNMTATCLINGNIDDRPGNEGKIQLCKDFLKFLYTEKELKNFSANTGVSKALMDYEIMSNEVLDDLDPYQKTIMNLRANNRVVNQYGDNDMYRNYSTTFVYSVSGIGYAPVIGTTRYSSILEVFATRTDDYANAWKMFTHLGQTEGTWAEMMAALQ